MFSYDTVQLFWNLEVEVMSVASSFIEAPTKMG